MTHHATTRPFPARVYWNSQIGRFSILARADGAGPWRVRYRAGYVRLADVRFVVRAAGRRKVLETGRKNVHAFAVGTVLDFDWDAPAWVSRRGRRLAYSPARHATFVHADDGSPAGPAPELVMLAVDGRPLLALPPLKRTPKRTTID